MMKAIGKSAKNKSFFHSLLESTGYRDLKDAFDKFLHRPMWWVTDKRSPGSILPITRLKRARGVEDYLSLADYKKNILKAMNQAEKSKLPVFFEASLNNTYGIAAPIEKQGKCVGFFGVYDLKVKPDPALLDILAGYVGIIIKEMNREKELTRLDRKSVV